MSSETDVVRRNKGTTRKSNKSSIALENGDSSKRGRRNRRRDSRNRRLIFIFLISGLLTLALMLLLRPRKSSIGFDTDRFARAKALRDAALKSGNSFLRKTKDKLEDLTEKQRRRRNNSAFLDLKKKFKGMRYLDPRQLPPLPGEPAEPYRGGKKQHRGFRGDGDDDWVPLAESLQEHIGPKVDYTKHKYSYPKLAYEPQNDGTYPHLEPMRKIFQTWEQDDLDSPPETIVEVLQHFDYQDPEQVKVS